MVHIEEVHNDEEVPGSKQEEENEINNYEENKEDSGSEDIHAEESGSQMSDSIEDEIDFSKPTPKNLLLENIRNFKPMRVKPRKTVSFDECGSCEESDDSGKDMLSEEVSVDEKKKKKKKKSKEENLTSKRAVALFMIFPMLVTGAVMVYEMLGRFKFEKSAMQFTASIGGALIALFFMSKVESLRSAVKFVFCFAWVIFLIPTYQVYSCSPIPLKNDMLGTWFSLKTDTGKFLESSYITCECFRSLKFHTPYKLSMMAPKIELKADISALINLNMEKEIPDDDASQSLSYFLLVSKRSVKKKFHKLYFLLEAAPKLADTLKRSITLTTTEKDKYLLRITGTVSDIEDSLQPMKNELESMTYLIRPIKFKVYSVQYVDRYVKLKSVNDESLY